MIWPWWHCKTFSSLQGQRLFTGLHFPVIFLKSFGADRKCLGMHYRQSKYPHMNPRKSVPRKVLSGTYFCLVEKLFSIYAEFMVFLSKTVHRFTRNALSRGSVCFGKMSSLGPPYTSKPCMGRMKTFHLGSSRMFWGGMWNPENVDINFIQFYGH